MNSVETKFTELDVTSGGLPYSMTEVMAEAVWAIDNRMDRFVSLAGGKDHAPAFIYGLNQNEIKKVNITSM